MVFLNSSNITLSYAWEMLGGGFILSRREESISLNYMGLLYGNKINILTRITLVYLYMRLTR